MGQARWVDRVEEGGRSTNRGLAVVQPLVLCVLQVADGGRGLGGLSAQRTPMLALTLFCLFSDIVSDLLRLGICADSARSTKQRLRPAAQRSGVKTSGISPVSACRRSSKIRDVGSVGRRLEPRLEPRRNARQRPKDGVYPALALKANRQTASRNPRPWISCRLLHCDFGWR